MEASLAGAGPGADAAPALQLWNLSKTFGGQKAFDKASLVIAQGEVHGLLGQNGSGKFTLIKVLAGFHGPDPGSRLEIAGADVALPLAPCAFRKHRMSFLHQHLGLIPSLTALENLLLGQLADRDEWAINWASTFRGLLSANPLARMLIPKRLAAVGRRLLTLAAANPDLAPAYKARAAVFAERARTFDPTTLCALAARRRGEAIAFMDRLEIGLADGRQVIVPPGYGLADVVWIVFLARMEFAPSAARSESGRRSRAIGAGCRRGRALSPRIFGPACTSDG